MKKTIILAITIIGVLLSAGVLYNNYLIGQYKPANMTNPAYSVDHNAHHQ